MTSKKYRVWSFSTTLRNPDRVIDFLKTLSEIENCIWNPDQQITFQSLLIKNRFYTPTVKNLLADNALKLKNLAYSLSLSEAKEIFLQKNYESPSMRGRTSFSPLEKLGLAYIKDDKVHITSIGKKIINNEILLEEAFLKILLKWEYPNHTSTDFIQGYDIKPFVATLETIYKVNKKIINKKKKNNYFMAPVGISKIEMSIFILSLINHADIDKVVDEILSFREKLSLKNTAKEKAFFIQQTKESKLSPFINAKDVDDYVDNIIRYFRMTKYIIVRGNGYYIDIDPTHEEDVKYIINSIKSKSSNFTKNEYYSYLENDKVPVLPSEELGTMINSYQYLINSLPVSITNTLIDINIDDKYQLKNRLIELRTINKKYLINKKIEYFKENRAILTDKLRSFILRKDKTLVPVDFEYYCSIGLSILFSDINVILNLNMGDDGEPVSHAPGNMPDIEFIIPNCMAGICEVTLEKSSKQYYMESQPIKRHLSSYGLKHNNNAVCLFIAPFVHEDTYSHFWLMNKYENLELNLKCLPISIEQFCSLIEKGEANALNFIETSLSMDNYLTYKDWKDTITHEQK